IRVVAEAEADAVVLQARAEATAQVIRAEAEATALRLVKAALEGDDDLLTYRYIDKLSPGVQVMLVPSDNPFLLPLPELNDENVLVDQTPAPTLSATSTATGGDLATPTPVPTSTLPALPDNQLSAP